VRVTKVALWRDGSHRRTLSLLCRVVNAFPTPSPGERQPGSAVDLVAAVARPAGRIARAAPGEPPAPPVPPVLSGRDQVSPTPTMTIRTRSRCRCRYRYSATMAIVWPSAPQVRTVGATPTTASPPFDGSGHSEHTLAMSKTISGRLACGGPDAVSNLRSGRARRAPSSTRPSRWLIRRPGQGARFGEFLAEFHPGIAGVVAGKQFAVVAAGEDPVGLRRVGRERPDR